MADEIQAAYLHYWDVRTQAYLSDDSSHLSEVMAGAELARAEKQIQDLKASGRAGKLDVDHHILIVSASPHNAVVYDEYLNRSVFIDLSTNREIAASAPPGTAKISYDMQKLNGVWKVVDGAQHD